MTRRYWVIGGEYEDPDFRSLVDKLKQYSVNMTEEVQEAGSSAF